MPSRSEPRGVQRRDDSEAGEEAIRPCEKSAVIHRGNDVALASTRCGFGNSTRSLALVHEFTKTSLGAATLSSQYGVDVSKEVGDSLLVASVTGSEKDLRFDAIWKILLANHTTRMFMRVGVVVAMS